MGTSEQNSTPTGVNTPPASSSPAANSTEDIRSPRPAPASTVQPVPVERSLKDISIFTKGSFVTSGKVVRAHDKVMTTNGSDTPYFFFVLQDGVCAFRPYDCTNRGPTDDFICSPSPARLLLGKNRLRGQERP